MNFKLTIKVVVRFVDAICEAIIEFGFFDGVAAKVKTYRLVIN